MSVNIELKRQVASNPSTLPEELRELAKSGDRTIRQNLAANPNTPTDVLFELGAEFPEQVLENPIFSLLLLENPNLANEMPIYTLASLLKLEKVPVFLMEQALNRKDKYDIADNTLGTASCTVEAIVGMALAMNSQAPITVLEKVLKTEDSHLQKAVELHVNIAGEMAAGWYEEAIDAIPNTNFSIENQEIAKRLADKGLMPLFLMDSLARHEDAYIRSFVASHSNISANILEDLARDSNNHVREAVANNPNTPVHLLEQLARDSDKQIRQSVVSNPSISVELLEQMALDTNKLVRRNVAKNPHTPINLLEKMALDKIKVVRASVASNPNTPTKLLEHLALDKEKLVRRGVASNPNTPVNLLNQLLGDEDMDVIRKITLNPSTPTNLLQELSNDKDMYVRASVA